MRTVECSPRDCLGNFSRFFPFRVTYEEVLFEVEHAEEEAKKVKRAPRSYDESDKKLKTVKIVTKKGDKSTDENKSKKPKPMAASRKPTAAAKEQAVQEEDEEEEEAGEDEETPMEETEEQGKPAEDMDEETLPSPGEKERVPLEEVQPTTLSVADKLKNLGKRPAPFSKAGAT